MGQQQLLLLVIAVVIVAFATLAAFYVLDTSYRKDEADGLLDRSLSIATQAVAWKSRNDMFAGGNMRYTRLTDGNGDPMERLALIGTNVRGRYRINVINDDYIQVIGVSDRYEGIGVCVMVDNYTIERSFVKFDGSITYETEDCEAEE